MAGRRNRPKVELRCPADRYALQGERIVEVSSKSGGCLISLMEREGQLTVYVYREDKTVKVLCAERMIRGLRK